MMGSSENSEVESDQIGSEGRTDDKAMFNELHNTEENYENVNKEEGSNDEVKDDDYGDVPKGDESLSENSEVDPHDSEKFAANQGGNCHNDDAQPKEEDAVGEGEFAIDSDDEVDDDDSESNEQDYSILKEADLNSLIERMEHDEDQRLLELQQKWEKEHGESKGGINFDKIDGTGGHSNPDNASDDDFGLEEMRRSIRSTRIYLRRLESENDIEHDPDDLVSDEDQDEQNDDNRDDNDGRGGWHEDDLDDQDSNQLLRPGRRRNGSKDDNDNGREEWSEDRLDDFDSNALRRVEQKRKTSDKSGDNPSDWPETNRDDGDSNRLGG